MSKSLMKMRHTFFSDDSVILLTNILHTEGYMAMVYNPNFPDVFDILMEAYWEMRPVKANFLLVYENPSDILAEVSATRGGFLVRKYVKA